MLYDRWRQISHEFRDELALHDFASSRRWTFGQLADEAESVASGQGAFCFPQGNSAEFIVTVLRGWRQGQVVCPLESGQTPAFENTDGLADNIVHLKTTSATSGSARCVAFTAGQLAADADNIVATMGLRRDWCNLGAISLAHSYGFSNLVTPLLLHGIPLIIVSAPLPETVRLAAALAKEITLPAVPAMWRAWHMAGTIPMNVKLAISAGAPLPIDLEEAVFATSGLKIHNFYGASECGGIAYDTADTPRTDSAFAGFPMKNIALAVEDDGCLTVRGGAVAETYWPPAPGPGAGMFHTGDLAEIVDEKLFLRGRAGDQINVAGRKVSPEFIERKLVVHPAVRECVVFGVPSRDVERLEEIVVVVVSEEKETALRQFALDVLPAWQVPRHWLFVESVQSTPRGKVSRAQWRQRWLATRA